MRKLTREEFKDVLLATAKRNDKERTIVWSSLLNKIKIEYINGDSILIKRNNICLKTNGYEFYYRANDILDRTYIKSLYNMITRNLGHSSEEAISKFKEAVV